jgi:hypothetical protein
LREDLRVRFFAESQNETFPQVFSTESLNFLEKLALVTYFKIMTKIEESKLSETSRIKSRIERRSNIRLPEWDPPVWRPDHVQHSLDDLRLYAERHARAAIDWYYKNKTWKARGSRFLRAFTILATAAGGLIPILVAAGVFARTGMSPTDVQLHNAQINQYGYLSIGLAALAIGLDRFFGASSGWMRYITAAMSLETTVEQFRFDWATLMVPLAGEPPQGPALEAIVQRITDFSLAVRAIVEDETRQWVSEFQTNMADLEKETKAALETARAQSENMQKEAASLRENSRVGAIDLTIENGDQADAGFDVFVDGALAKHGVGRTCAVPGLSPSLHTLLVTGAMGGDHAQAEQAVAVQANAIAKVSLTLLKAKVARP